ncbi:MAG: bifunctional UDP-N-acetylglucosamine diphosphorylase/glucosamine-1-phosphate N-acetyltransferase GlmU [Deltaproteobacteria bacterium]|nr:bifunctional UDP-N-acetylglucosamine diphosphorylase/glucosamine-1-phosphate N-acetyltransferase GlmU [Deltaproteobacteria bacterium]
MATQQIAAVVLAAGLGKRMRSSLPKVMHEVAGLPMVAFPVQAAFEAGASRVVVVTGHGRADVESFLRRRFGHKVAFALQAEQLGTAHAVLQARRAIEDFDGPILILYGDVPLVPPDLLSDLATSFREKGAMLALATCHLDDPLGYGRILRGDAGRIVAIREHKDCSDAELRIKEVNPGLYVVDRRYLYGSLGSLSANNAQGELYLTDLVELAARKGLVVGVEAEAAPLRGVNDRAELARAEVAMRARIARRWMLAGATLRDPASTFIGPDVEIGVDTVIGARVELRGCTRVGNRCRVDVGCVVTDTEVNDGAELLPYSVVTESRIGKAARIGPFAHLRPSSDIGEQAHVGNFVELKKTVLGAGSKANHLAYLGDGVVGEDVNVGAGTIFCNYDGFGKYTTTLEDGCFIGSDSQLVAPVRVGKGAYVGTGSTITMDVPDGALAIARAHQVNKEGYAEKVRARLKAKKAEAAQAVDASEAVNAPVVAPAPVATVPSGSAGRAAPAAKAVRKGKPAAAAAAAAGKDRSKSAASRATSRTRRSPRRSRG